LEVWNFYEIFRLELETSEAGKVKRESETDCEWIVKRVSRAKEMKELERRLETVLLKFSGCPKSFMKSRVYRHATRCL